jgi:hypothetical protein
MTIEAMERKEKKTKKQNTRANDIIAIARSAYEAYVAKNRAAIEKLIAADFHFTSPLENRIDRTTYFARCWPNSERIDGFKFTNLCPIAVGCLLPTKVTPKMASASVTPRL